jgi:truncated hemoglobin YjbI
MPALHDQLSDESIAAVIEAFYRKVQQDPALGPVFARAIADHEWPEHLRVIRDFWSSYGIRLISSAWSAWATSGSLSRG